MKIKDVENKVGISVHTIRFYEEAGLISVKRKPESMYRDFTEEDVNKLKEIKLLRNLGITMEEIRRYYAKEITLAEMMEHYQGELHIQSEEMHQKEKLCEDIIKGNVPFIPYTVDRYNDVFSNPKTKLPYQEAGSLLMRWGEKQYSKKRLFLFEIVIFPLFVMIIYILLVYTLTLLEMLEMDAYYVLQKYAFIIALFGAIILCYIQFVMSIRKPGELYEFCENGLYYVNKDTKRTFKEIHKALHNGSHKDCYDFVSYEAIKIFKVHYRVVGKVGVTGSNVYQVDFRLFTTDDEMIEVNTGIIGTTDEKIKITAELLKEYAKKVVDPYHILDHLDDSKTDFYTFIDEIHRQRMYKRIGLSD